MFFGFFMSCFLGGQLILSSSVGCCETSDKPIIPPGALNRETVAFFSPVI